MEAEMRNMKVDAQETRLIARQAKDNTDEILSILKGAKFWTAVALGVIVFLSSSINLWKLVPGH